MHETTLSITLIYLCQRHGKLGLELLPAILLWPAERDHDFVDCNECWRRTRKERYFEANDCVEKNRVHWEKSIRESYMESGSLFRILLTFSIEKKTA